MPSKFIFPNELLIRFFQAACEMEHVLWNPPPVKMERTGSRSRHLQPILRSCYEASTILRSLIDGKADLWQTVVDIPYVNGEAPPELSNTQGSVLDVYLDCDRVVDVHDRKVMIYTVETMDFINRNAPRTRAIHLRGHRVSILEVAYEISQDISSFSQLLTFNLIHNDAHNERFTFAGSRVPKGNLLDLNAPRISSLSMGLSVSHLADFPPVLVADIRTITDNSIRLPPQDLCLHLCRLSINLDEIGGEKAPDWSGLVFPRLRWLKTISRSNGQALQRLFEAEFGVLRDLCIESGEPRKDEYEGVSQRAAGDERCFTCCLETFEMNGSVGELLWLFERYSFPSLCVARFTIRTSGYEREIDSKDHAVTNACLAKRLEITSDYLPDVITFLTLATFAHLAVLQFRSTSLCPRLSLGEEELVNLPSFDQVHTLVLDLHTLPFLRHIKSSILTHVVLHYGNKGTVWTIDVHMRQDQDSDSEKRVVFPHITELSLILSGGIPWMEYLLRFFPNVQIMNVHLLGDASATSLVKGLVGVKEAYVKTPECPAPSLRWLRIRDAGRRPFSGEFLSAMKDYLRGRIEAPSADAVEVLHLAPEPTCDDDGAEIDGVRRLVFKEFQTFSLAAFPLPDQ